MNWQEKIEAANRIEELEAENEKLQKSIDGYCKIVARLNKEAVDKTFRIEELEAHLVISKGKHENCIKQNERLRELVTAVLAHRDNKEFLNVDTWQRCVRIAEALAAVEEDDERTD